MAFTLIWWIYIYGIPGYACDENDYNTKIYSSKNAL